MTLSNRTGSREVDPAEEEAEAAEAPVAEEASGALVAAAVEVLEAEAADPAP